MIYLNRKKGQYEEAEPVGKIASLEIYDLDSFKSFDAKTIKKSFFGVQKRRINEILEALKLSTLDKKK
jgi:hypothetical protein